VDGFALVVGGAIVVGLGVTVRVGVTVRFALTVRVRVTIRVGVTVGAAVTVGVAETVAPDGLADAGVAADAGAVVVDDKIVGAPDVAKVAADVTLPVPLPFDCSVATTDAFAPMRDGPHDFVHEWIDGEGPEVSVMAPAANTTTAALATMRRFI
jgi:hypothetical protein